jgi:2-dehydropantoate 2-reductase
MRIAIFGTGGVGGYFGGRLAKAGENVTFIARGEHLRAMRESGLKVDSLEDGFSVNPVNATDDPSEVGHVDLVVLGVKAWQVTEAAHKMRPMVGATTVVVPLQNGVDAPAQLADVLGVERVLGGLCRIVSFVVGPGHIKHAGFDPTVTLGELNNQPSARLEKVHTTFTRAGIKTLIADNFEVALWTKFLFIASFSGVGAMTGKAAGELRTDPMIRAQLIKAMEEIYALARARNIDMPADSVEKGMANADRLPADGTSSMQRDIADGKPSELESQTGAVVRMAREMGVAVPTHELIYSKLKPVAL